MNDKDFENFKILIEKKHKNIVKYDEAINLLSDKKIDKFLNRLVFYLLFSKRKIKFF